MTKQTEYDRGYAAGQMAGRAEGTADYELKGEALRLAVQSSSSPSGPNIVSTATDFYFFLKEEVGRQIDPGSVRVVTLEK